MHTYIERDLPTKGLKAEQVKRLLEACANSIYIYMKTYI